MCVIIDACVRDEIFTRNPGPDARPVLEWIESRGGRMVYGGKKLRSELFGSSFASRQIKTWKQAGLAIEVLDDRVDSEAVKIQKSGQVESNDAHIIALAVVSGARTLYSRDEVLHEDFKNPRLIDNPRGKVYQSAAKHIKLLEHTISCRRD